MIFVQNHNISRSFFHFFKILIFWVVRSVKGQKMAHNDKKLCRLLVISQEPYIIWSWSMVHKCKRIISLGVFYIFSKFFTKNYVCCTPYLSKHTSFFSFFQNSDFSCFSQFINTSQKEILRCAPPSSHVCDFF